MSDHGKPLTEMERRVFGDDATRDADGNIVERGIGSRMNPTARQIDLAMFEKPRAVDPAPPPAAVPPGPEPGLWAPSTETVQ
jgi:hypothetical protein